MKTKNELAEIEAQNLSAQFGKENAKQYCDIQVNEFRKHIVNKTTGSDFCRKELLHFLKVKKSINNY